jgi:2,4-dienoyl-CoA reductase-like NADH-dependent reductase (Old Yellow Enzyme family)
MKLFTPYKLGPYQLKNRMVMAPMTRNRAGKGFASARECPLLRAASRSWPY